MEIGLILAVLFFVAGVSLSAISSLGDLKLRAAKYDELKPKLDSLDAYQKQLEADADRRRKQIDSELHTKQETLRKQFDEESMQLYREKQHIKNIKTAWTDEQQRLINESIQLRNSLESGFINGRAWLSSAYSEYLNTLDMELECSLILKPNPAWKAAETVKNLRIKRVEMAKELKQLQYQVNSYEEYFPFLLEYRDSILDEAIDLRGSARKSLEEGDPALTLGYLSKDDYENLPSAEKFQLSLDRYWAKHKSKQEIGRLYERYAGYLYEIDGWSVSYNGIMEGFEDFGRDLICTKGKQTIIVQCKYWSKHKKIREKHLMQLFGTYILYCVTTQKKDVKAVFMSGTDNLSTEALMVAKELNIEVRIEPLERYPMIKCNTSQGTKKKIYHLPFDQQYDRIMMGDHKEKFYVETTYEAESYGFRRAYRWKGGSSE